MTAKSFVRFSAGLALALCACIFTACDPHGGKQNVEERVNALKSEEGAGGDSAPAATEPAASGASGATPSIQNVGGAPTATIRGKTTFKGVPAPRKKIGVMDNADCAKLHTEADQPLDESIVVGAGGELENVLIYVTKGLEGQKFPAPSEPVIFDQKGCVYIPHILTLMVGQTLEVRNSDPLMHNVHLLPASNREENKSQPPGSPALNLKFRRIEAKPFRIKCDVHAWMQAYGMVLDHPYSTVARQGGAFELPKIAPGTYAITAWHEKLGTQTQTVTVADGETREIAFEFEQK
jgi:plastocyanin